jgi:hypothetical protein
MTKKKQSYTDSSFCYNWKTLEQAQRLHHSEPGISRWVHFQYEFTLMKIVEMVAPVYVLLIRAEAQSRNHHLRSFVLG